MLLAVDTYSPRIDLGKCVDVPAVSLITVVRSDTSGNPAITLSRAIGPKPCRSVRSLIAATTSASARTKSPSQAGL
jgi:hypothetical protein